MHSGKQRLYGNDIINYFFAGKSTITLHNIDSGYHRTYQIKKGKKKRMVIILIHLTL